MFHGTTRHGSAAPFEYKVAAAFSGKRNVFDKAKHHFNFDSATSSEQWGDPTPIQRGLNISSGQDGFFAGQIGNTKATACAVADGVGGYQDSGIDSAAFAHGLCKHLKQSAKGFPEPFRDTTDQLKPLELLKRGYEKVCKDASIAGGGSTACVAVAQPDGMLHVANLGDSGFIQLRLNAVNHYSNPQTHAFNTPFQLSQVPPKVLAQIENFGGNRPFGDLPQDASLSSHQLNHGDVIVFATDGVWDNLTSQEILDRVSDSMMSSGAWTAPSDRGIGVSKALPWLTNDGIPSMSGNDRKEGLRLQTLLATDITSKAKAASVNMKRDGPFAKAVQQAYPNERWSGGKVDDICVVVMIAVQSGV